jgi:hypothetical protein
VRNVSNTVFGFDFGNAVIASRSLNALFAAASLAASCFPGAATAAQSTSTFSEQNARELERLLAIPAGKLATSCSHIKPPRTPVGTLDRFLMWNEIALDTTAIDHTPDPRNPMCFHEQLGPHRSSRAMTIVHIAIFDAENAISKKYESYTGISRASDDVSRDRTIAQAAHDTLVALYPGQRTRLNNIFNLDIATITGSPASIAAGAALGMQAAQSILALRGNDGSELPEPTVMDNCTAGDNSCFPANHAPGKWQVDPISGLTVALGANWPQVKPFVMTSADQFCSSSPPALRARTEPQCRHT